MAYHSVAVTVHLTGFYSSSLYSSSTGLFHLTQLSILHKIIPHVNLVSIYGTVLSALLVVSGMGYKLKSRSHLFTVICRTPLQINGERPLSLLD